MFAPLKTCSTAEVADALAVHLRGVHSVASLMMSGLGRMAISDGLTAA